MVGRVALITVVIVTLACTSSTEVKSVTSPALTGGHLGSIGTPGCQPAAALHSYTLPEAGMDTSRGSIWALFFGPVPPKAGQEVKVVWRMTGAGDFTFRVSDLEGNTIPLLGGPVAHGASTWVHPGNEVGTGFKFPHAGCWRIHVARADVDADLWLEVVA
jgi:hypothetical protein